MKDDNKASENEDLDRKDLDSVDEESQAGQDDYGDDWEDDPQPIETWKMVLIFAGLVVLAAVICSVLWFFTHKDNGVSPDDMVTDPTGVITETPDPETLLAEGQMSQTTEPGDTEAEGKETEGTESERAESGGIEAEGTGSGGTETEGTEAGGIGTESGSTETEGTVTAPSAAPEVVDTPKPADNPTVNSSPEPNVQPETQDGDISMKFEVVQQVVTPKDVVNLRSVPSTADADTVVTQANNGEVLSRIGMNSDTGWSQIDYNGQILYAVSQYLTTDLSYKTPVTPADPNRVSTISGRLIVFTDCDDHITPKEYVNLRTEPSTTEGDATVSCQVSNGESVHRTGVSADSGWSRVEYNGQVLYVVTSLMQVVE